MSVGPTQIKIKEEEFPATNYCSYTAPKEIVLEIFKKLDLIKHFRTLQLVCKSWKDISEDSSLWVSICVKFKIYINNREVSAHLAVKTKVKSYLLVIEEAEKAANEAELTYIYFENLRNGCFSSEKFPEERNKKLSKIEDDLEDYQKQLKSRCEKIEAGYNNCLYLSLIGIYSSKELMNHFLTALKNKKSFLDSTRNWASKDYSSTRMFH